MFFTGLLLWSGSEAIRSRFLSRSCLNHFTRLNSGRSIASLAPLHVPERPASPENNVDPETPNEINGPPTLDEKPHDHTTCGLSVKEKSCAA